MACGAAACGWHIAGFFPLLLVHWVAAEEFK